jgi:hypothetical protein
MHCFIAQKAGYRNTYRNVSKDERDRINLKRQENKRSFYDERGPDTVARGLEPSDSQTLRIDLVGRLETELQQNEERRMILSNTVSTEGYDSDDINYMPSESVLSHKEREADKTIRSDTITPMDLSAIKTLFEHGVIGEEVYRERLASLNIEGSCIRTNDIIVFGKSLNISQSQLGNYFGDKLLSGNSYFREGRLMNIVIKIFDRNYQLNSSCRGKSGIYTQESVLENDTIVRAICDCPMKVGCKHIAAQLLFCIGGIENIKQDEEACSTSTSKTQRKRNRVVEHSSGDDDDEPSKSLSRTFIELSKNPESIGSETRIKRSRSRK